MSTTRSRTLYGVIVVLVALLVIVSTIAVLYYVQYSQEASANSTYIQQLRQLDVKYLSSILFDYGNGTRTWYNDTKLQPGTNLYVATQIITNGRVNATYYAQYSSHFVTAIYNVGNTNSLYWLLWTYNRTASWQEASLGPDELQAYNGSIYAWIYCGSNCTAP